MKLLCFARHTCLLAALSIPLSVAPAHAQDNDRMNQLEEKVDQLTKIVEGLQEELRLQRQENDNLKKEDEEKNQILLSEIGALKKTAGSKSPDHWSNKMTLGGYSELHFNRVDGSERDMFDFHRYVMYFGYEFAPWVHFHSELEVEHSFVQDDDGEVTLEQAYMDFNLHDAFNVRAGRVLAPLGIINQRHEPTTFNGVERPTFANVIIPTTWSLDGAGFFGRFGDSFKYEAYVTGGLNGALFNSTSGIRNGRMKERPGASHPAFSGRFDWFPIHGKTFKLPQSLRVGVSGFVNDLDNGDEGANPDLTDDPQLVIYAADLEYSISRFDFRAEWALERISDAEDIGNNVAEEITGFYIEGAYHWWPESFKQGKWVDSDSVVFVRYENLDTQHEMPAGIVANPAGDREEITVGVSFFPVKNVVIKIDYQFKEDERPGDAARNQFNIGIGWDF